MSRRKMSAAEYIEDRSLFVPLIIGDLIQHLGEALEAWSRAVWAAEQGDLERAQKAIVEIDVTTKVPMKVVGAEIREIVAAAYKRLEAELPDDDDDDAEVVPPAFS